MRQKEIFGNMLCILLFLLLTFIPIIGIGEFRIPTMLLLFPVLLFKKQVYIEKKTWLISSLSTVALLLLYLPNVIGAQGVALKDIVFVFFPLYACFLYHFIVNIFGGARKDLLQRCIKAFLIIQLLFCILQLTNLFNSNDSLRNLYFYWQENNAQKMNTYLEVSYRAFGTMGSPILLAIVSYLFGLYLKKTDKRNIWFYYLSILLVFLSGARMALLAIILIELYNRVVRVLLKKPLVGIISLIVMVLGCYMAITYVPFINHLFTTYITGGSDVFSDYSVSYRLDMVDYLKNNTQYLLLGGYGSSNLPEYVDSEIILRVLEFGVVGIISMCSLYIYKYFEMKNDGVFCKKEELNSMMFFLLMCSVTSVVFTNFLLSQVIMMCIFFFGHKRNHEEATI